MQGIRVSSGDTVAALQFLLPPSGFQIALLNAEVSFVSVKRGAPDLEIDAQELSSHLQTRFSGQVLTANQELTFEFQVGAGGVQQRWVGELGWLT